MRALKIRMKDWTVPVALLATCLLSFALLIPTLGFYWDDWPSLVITKIQGPHGFYEFFRLDRPTTHFSYLLLMPLLGTDPVRWQIFTLALRWITAVLLWWTVRKFWPGSGSLAAWAALIFAVHPIFRQQNIALTYHQLWLQYIFYMLSIGAMAAAVRASNRYWVWTGVALVALLLNFLISEYFLGIEMLRPVWLGVLLWPQIQNVTASGKLKRLLLHWLPYLLLLISYLAWRFVFLDLPGEDRNAPLLLSNLLSNPLSTGVQLIQMALQDAIYIIAASWYETLQPTKVDLQSTFSLAAIALTLLTALITAVYLFFYQPHSTQEEMGNHRTNRTVALLGLILVIIAPLPGWVTGRQVTIGAFSDRLAVPAMLGASLLIAGGIAWLIRGRLQQVVMISLLIGLAAGQNLRVTNDFRWARTQSNRLYWQMYWRAPGLLPQTAVMSEGEILSKMGLYSTAAGINLLYADPSPSGELPYWYYGISREYGHRMPELLAGISLKTSFRQFTFEGDSRNSVIVYYESRGDCLRVLTPEDIHDPELTPLMMQAVAISNISRIMPEGKADHLPSKDIFGPEPEHSWCYLFQKADLAHQQKDWQKVTALGDQAEAAGYNLQNSQSNTPQEWVTFLEGYAHTGRWQDAADLSREIFEKDPRMAARLCDSWSGLNEQYAGVAEIEAVRGSLNCP